MTTTIQVPLTLPDDLAEEAKARGLLAGDVLDKILVAALRERLSAEASPPSLPPGYDPRLRGLVDPALFRKGALTGDVLAPVGAEWEADA